MLTMSLTLNFQLKVVHILQAQTVYRPTFKKFSALDLSNAGALVRRTRECVSMKATSDEIRTTLTEIVDNYPQLHSWLEERMTTHGPLFVLDCIAEAAK